MSSLDRRPYKTERRTDQDNDSGAEENEWVTNLVVGDGDLVGFTSGLVGSRDVEDTVGIDIKGDFDLRDTTRRRGNAGKFKFTEKVVILCAGTFTFVDLDQHSRLVIGVGGKDFSLLGRHSCVSLNQRSEDTTGSLDTHGEGCDIQEQQVLGLLGSVTRKDSSLDSGTVGNSLIGVDGLVGFFTVDNKR